MLRLTYLVLFALVAPTIAIADSAASVSPLPFDKFSELAEKRIVKIGEETKAAILAMDGDTSSKEFAHIAKLLRNGTDAVTLKEFGPVLEGDGGQVIASTMTSHDDSVIRFYSNLVLASSGNSDSAAALHKLIHDEFLELTDKQMIKTWCEGVGIRAANDDSEKILEHLVTMASEQTRFKKGDAAPDFEVTTTSGRTISLSKLRGKVVVLHFWATSCSPCLGQMPSHISALEKYDQKKVEGLFVSLDADEKKFESTVEKFKIPFSNVCDKMGWGGELVRAYGVNRLPFDVIIDADGKIASNSISDIAEMLAKSPIR